MPDQGIDPFPVREGPVAAIVAQPKTVPPGPSRKRSIPRREAGACHSRAAPRSKIHEAEKPEADPGHGEDTAQGTPGRGHVRCPQPKGDHSPEFGQGERRLAQPGVDQTRRQPPTVRGRFGRHGWTGTSTFFRQATYHCAILTQSIRPPALMALKSCF